MLVSDEAWDQQNMDLRFLNRCGGFADHMAHRSVAFFHTLLNRLLHIRIEMCLRIDENVFSSKRRKQYLEEKCNKKIAYLFMAGHSL